MRAPLLLLAALGCGSSAAPPPKGPVTPTMALPLWIEGAWISDDGQSTEHWHAAGGALFGVGFPAGGPAFEVMIIAATPAGTVRFTAWPGGDGGVPFDATAQDGERIVFANPAHDFPKELGYQRAGAALTAFIGGDGRRQEYRWRQAQVVAEHRLEESDRQFDQDTLMSGASGWSAWFDPEGAQWRPKRGRVVGPVAIRELMHPAFDEKGLVLRWIPRASGLSPAGDLGFTIGDYVATTKAGEKSTGGYVTVWRKQSDGNWKVLFDVGT